MSRGGSQDYFQTFSAIAPDRQTERLTNDQTVPDDFFTAGGQWMRTWKAADVLSAPKRPDDGRHQRDAVPRRRSAGVDLEPGSRRQERISVWTRALRDEPGFLAGSRRARRSLEVDALDGASSAPGDSDVAGERPGVAAVLGGALVSHADAQRALSRLPRRQRRHQRQSAARAGAPDQRRGRRAPRHGRASARVTAFHNVLDDAISNITLSTTPALTTRERQNADQVGSSGVEVEGDCGRTRG